MREREREVRVGEKRVLKLASREKRQRGASEVDDEQR
jgi:hypothetical protein